MLFLLLVILTKIDGEIRVPVRHNLRLDGGSLPLVFHTLLCLSCIKLRLEFFRTLHPFHSNILNPSIRDGKKMSQEIRDPE
jgi:hypothetical protein